MTSRGIHRVAMLSVHTCPLAMLGGKETGGMNVYVRDLARALNRRGIDVDVFTRSQNPEVPRVSHALGAHGRVIHLPAGPERPYDKNQIYYHLPQFVEGVLEFAAGENLQYDVIHSHYWLSGLVARDLRAAWGTPIVHMFHTLGRLKNRVAQSAAEYEPEMRIAGEHEVMRLADRLVAATALEREQMQELYGADPAKIVVVPPGVDLNRFRPIPAAIAKGRIGLSCDNQIVLFVGRIQAIKGIDTLIRAMAVLLERHGELREVVCVGIIGGNPDSDEGEMGRLKALRESLGISDLVTFVGATDQDSLANYYSAASMVVVPSHYESFGLVALEAMACGVPVIASDVGGLSFSVADGFNGYLVPSGNPEALAAKIALLLTNDALRQSLGRQARRWVQRYSWSNIASEILAVFEEVLAERSGGPVPT